MLFQKGAVSVVFCVTETNHQFICIPIAVLVHVKEGSVDCHIDTFKQDVASAE